MLFVEGAIKQARAGKSGNRLHSLALALVTVLSLLCVEIAHPQNLFDGPSACGVNALAWTKFADNPFASDSIYGARPLPLTQCSGLLQNESCIGLFSYSFAHRSVTDIFVGPPPVLQGGAGYPDAFAIDPGDRDHLFYISRHILFETRDGGRTWQSVIDMSVVRASAGRSSGDYQLKMTPDGATLIEGNQVSDDGGKHWRKLPHTPRLVTQQNVYYDFGLFFGIRSNDRGATWQSLALTGYPHNLSNKWVADSSSSSILYALVSGNFGDRIARSRDGGTSWTVVMSVGPSDPVALTNLVASPDTPGLLYVSGRTVVPNETQLWKSTDGGDTWVSFEGQPASHLRNAGCGGGSLAGVLDRQGSVPLLFRTTGGTMILFDGPEPVPAQVPLSRELVVALVVLLALAACITLRRRAPS